jgi:hypothetical protein
VIQKKTKCFITDSTAKSIDGYCVKDRKPASKDRFTSTIKLWPTQFDS